MRFHVRGGLGDEIALLPVLEAWRRANPDVIFHADVNARQAELFAGHPAVGGGTVEDGQTWNFRAMGKGFPGNLCEYYASQVGVKLEDPTPKLHLTAAEKVMGLARVSRFGRGAKIAVDPWASWPSRRWPFERFQQLVRWMRGRQIAVIEVGKAVPTEDFTRPPGRLEVDLSLWEELDIRGTAAVVAACDLVVGNDSALMHLGAAVGTPQVAIFSVVPWYNRAYWNTTHVQPQVCCEGGCAAFCVRVKDPIPCLRSVTVDEVGDKVLMAMDRFGR